MNLRLEEEKPTRSAEDELGWETVFTKLEEYRKYKDDWDGEGSPAIDPQIMEGASVLAIRLKGSESPPRVVPTVNGTISLEWFTLDRFRSLEIVSSTRVVETSWIKADGNAVVVDRTLDELA